MEAAVCPVSLGLLVTDIAAALRLLSEKSEIFCSVVVQVVYTVDFIKALVTKLCDKYVRDNI